MKLILSKCKPLIRKASTLTYFHVLIFNEIFFFRLKKIQDKKKIAKGKAEVLRLARKEEEAESGNMLEGEDEDLLF